MTTKRIKKLESGLYAVTLMVSEDVIRFVHREAKRGGFRGPADYLNAVLNTAMLREMEDEPLSEKEIETRREAAAASEDGLSV